MDGNILGEIDGEKDETLAGANFLSAEDRGWISPPDSIYSSSSGGRSISGEPSPSNGFSLQESVEHLSINSNNEEVGDRKELLFTGADQEDTLHAAVSNEMEAKDGTDFSSCTQPTAPRDGVSLPMKLSADALPCRLKEGNLDVNLEGKEEPTSSKRVGDDSQNDRLKKDGIRTIKGKNAIAISVLRRIEMKLDGRDISENRELSIGEQVDYLLKQATSADNLCNMYEGWTAWI